MQMVSTSATVPWRDDAKVMGLVGMAHASSHFSHLLLPLMFPVFMRDFGWSFSELGMLSSLFFVVSGAGQACAGFVVDRVGARPVLYTSQVLFMLACVLAYSANSYGALLWVAVLAGLGNAPFHPVDFTILNQRVSTPQAGLCLQRAWLDGQSGLGRGSGVFYGEHRSVGVAPCFSGCGCGLRSCVGRVVLAPAPFADHTHPARCQQRSGFG